MDKKTSRNLIIVALTAVLASTSFILGSYFYYQTGFPLDDAWIYQTYARNLGNLGEWAFIPGSESGGSTGPLWVIFLTTGYILPLDPEIWTYFLGIIILIGLGILGMYGVRLIQPDIKRFALFGGLVLVFEWHLIWASVSGMETLLFAFVILTTLVWLTRPRIGQREWFLIGIVIGISVWIRPDGITLLGPAILAVITSNNLGHKQIAIRSSLLAIGFATIFGLYLLFNHITSGSIWPNTFYAKQAEYMVLRNAPILYRFGRQFIAPLTGIGIALLPGFILSIYLAYREKRWAVLGSAIWFIGYLGIYAIRLPVTYQHGRYVIPAMPIYFVLGFTGAIYWIVNHFQDHRIIPRVTSKVWLISGICILVLFWFLGAKTYAEDTAIIESEMVATAQWIQANTSPDALIAAHDIGALGYFGQRKIVDLAGLIAPDVIPFIRDETQLENYLNDQKIEYLMTFPEWYPILTSHARLVFQTRSPYSPNKGGENMAVYHWVLKQSQ